jgi:hypothetical protein
MNHVTYGGLSQAGSKPSGKEPKKHNPECINRQMLCSLTSVRCALGGPCPQTLACGQPQLSRLDPALGSQGGYGSALQAKDVAENNTYFKC